MPLVLDLRAGIVESRWVSDKQLVNELLIAFMTSSLRLLLVKASRESGLLCSFDDIVDAEIAKDGSSFLNFPTLILQKDDEKIDGSD